MLSKALLRLLDQQKTNLSDKGYSSHRIDSCRGSDSLANHCDSVQVGAFIQNLFREKSMGYNQILAPHCCSFATVNSFIIRRKYA